jgi:triosephosphate isomerase (TIM)
LAPALGEVLLLNKASNAKRRQLVVGNWKMNGSLCENTELLSKILAGWQGKNNADIVICPPFPYLEHTRKLLSDSTIMLGAQTVMSMRKVLIPVRFLHQSLQIWIANL